jgi:putative membrane protein
MRAGVLIPTVLITAAAVACGGGKTGDTSTASNSSGMSAAADSGKGDSTRSTASGDVAGGAASNGPSDANILGVMHEANQAEIQAAQLALNSSSNPQVKSFAHQMIRDHMKLDHAGDSVAKAANLAPEPPANDSLPGHVRQESAALRAAGHGAGFDKLYMDDQVQDHETVLALLQQFQGQAQNLDVKAAVSSAIPIVQGHLNRAKKLAATVGSTNTQS